ncbi:MAG: PEP-CTERM sorting domain-containing protein [Nitrospirae bacterium]|nr:PEP-CTERM sorting domain-containing protein [Nitrospirota bacterium]
MKTLRILCLMLVILSATLTSAYATAFGTSEATLYWDSLNITMMPGMGLNWVSQGSDAGASAQYNSVVKDNQYYAMDTWGDISSSASYATGSGSAGGTGSIAASILHSISTASSDNGGSFTGNSRASRFGEFIVSGSGEITFSINYFVTHTLYETQPRPWDLATAFSATGINVANKSKCSPDPNDPNNVICLSSDSGWEGTLWSPDWNLPLNGTLSKSGTLTISLPFDDGETGRFYAGVESPLNAASAVPEPSTLLLLGSGLTWLVGFGRKRLIKKS